MITSKTDTFDIFTDVNLNISCDLFSGSKVHVDILHDTIIEGCHILYNLYQLKHEKARAVQGLH